MMINKEGKVRAFWEAHKNLRNLPHALDIYLVKDEEDFFKFCVFLRKSELKQTRLFVHTPEFKNKISNIYS